VNFYQRFLGDYMRDTMHLSMVEHGAYTLLLDTYYATEKPLPADYDALYRICRAMSKAEREVVKKVADEFFKIGSDGLRHNRRADEEIASAKPKIKAAQENGKKGGRPKTKEEPTGFHELNLEVTELIPIGKAHHNQNHIPEPTPEPEVSDGQKTPSAGSIAFSRYAAAYTKRYGTNPVPNAKTRSIFKQFVERIPADEAPEVAEFYVRHDDSFYVRSGHSAEVLLKNAEKLRTEWFTGRKVTAFPQRSSLTEGNMEAARRFLEKSGEKS